MDGAPEGWAGNSVRLWTNRRRRHGIGSRARGTFVPRGRTPVHASSSTSSTGRRGVRGELAAADRLPADPDQDQGVGQAAQDLELEGLAGLGHLDHLAERHHGEPVDGGREPQRAEPLAGAAARRSGSSCGAQNDQRPSEPSISRPPMSSRSPSRNRLGRRTDGSSGTGSAGPGHAVAAAVVDPGLLLARDVGVVVTWTSDRAVDQELRAEPIGHIRERERVGTPRGRPVRPGG